MDAPLRTPEGSYKQATIICKDTYIDTQTFGEESHPESFPMCNGIPYGSHSG